MPFLYQLDERLSHCLTHLKFDQTGRYPVKMKYKLKIKLRNNYDVVYHNCQILLSVIGSSLFRKILNKNLTESCLSFAPQNQVETKKKEFCSKLGFAKHCPYLLLWGQSITKFYFSMQALRA